MNNEDVIKFVDGQGNIVDGVDGQCTIGNKQLHFLAYSMFTAMKHGYLGKHNRKPIPSCIECGVHQDYPDVNKTYVGFHTAEEI
jgi:hypothetical protein